MATKGNSGELRTRSPISIFLVVGLCFSSYLLGSWQRSKLWKGDKIAEGVMNHTDCNILPNFNYERSGEAGILDDVTGFEVKEILPCDEMYIDHTPCQDHRGRHCNSDSEKLHCLIPAPKGYATPFPWPKSRHYVPYANVQSSMMHDGDVFRFPGNGADAYVNLISSLVPLDGGVVRTALDTGCGVANFGAYIIEKNVLAMSFAPRGSHEAQVQFALERGVPAVVGVLETFKLPYPSGAFDMAHCSSCLIPWGANDGMYMMEVDRVLRPGGYWILSGPPINWRRSKDDLKAERTKIEEIARLLCWEKKKDQLGTEIAIWQKSLDPDSCIEHLTMCESLNPNDVWYNKMEPCVTPSAKVDSSEWKSFPERLYAVPSRISSGAIPGVSPERYLDDSRIWKKHVNAYRRVNKILDTGRYRNVMDMNAGMGGFAAALESPKLWVMNVMPTAAEKDTLGVIYERGLIGIYHDWCEAFSTYPRTYDLIHANGVFSLYRDKCSMEDILLEMDRILRPEGTVIIRDEVGVLVKVKRTVSGMRWNTKMVDHEDGPTVPEKVMFAVKRYWVAGEQNGNHTN